MTSRVWWANATSVEEAKVNATSSKVNLAKLAKYYPVCTVSGSVWMGSAK
jgi:hypothetical protein